MRIPGIELLECRIAPATVVSFIALSAPNHPLALANHLDVTRGATTDGFDFRAFEGG